MTKLNILRVDFINLLENQTFVGLFTSLNYYQSVVK